jgi:hypothetical protein
MGILHHSRKRVAFSGVSRYYTLFHLLIPLSYHREVEKKRTITGLRGTYLFLVHEQIFSYFFFEQALSAFDPRPSGIGCN